MIYDNTIKRKKSISSNSKRKSKKETSKDFTGPHFPSQQSLVTLQ